MTYLPTEFVSAELTEARNIMSRPDLYDDETIAAACATACRIGDWMDIDRATRLTDALRIERAARAEQAEESHLERALVWGLMAVGMAAFYLTAPTWMAWIIKLGGEFVGRVF